MKNSLKTWVDLHTLSPVADTYNQIMDASLMCYDSSSPTAAYPKFNAFRTGRTLTSKQHFGARFTAVTRHTGQTAHDICAP